MMSTILFSFETTKLPRHRFQIILIASTEHGLRRLEIYPIMTVVSLWRCAIRYHAFETTGEVLQRIVNHFCIDHTCGDIDHFGNETFYKVKHQTSWYSLLSNPSWSSSDLLPDLIRAIVNDLKCNYASYSLDHYTTQSVFVSQNKGISDPIDVIIQIENSNSGLAKVSTHAHHGKSNHCSLKESNSAVTKPKGIPSSRDIFKVINEDNSIIRELCLIYIQVSC